MSDHNQPVFWMLGVGLMILAPVIVFVFLWWWALAGVSEPIGIASMITAAMVFFAGVIVCTVAE